MARYNQTERLGVSQTQTCIIDEIGWIFRELSIADVGIDALIEESIDGNPTGRFLAVQIKSGEGNFHITKSCLTLSVSRIHYNYWINNDFTIILVAYLPKERKLYWEVISKKTLREAKKQWKIDIPLNKNLNAQARFALKKLLKDKQSSTSLNYFYNSFNTNQSYSDFSTMKEKEFILEEKAFTFEQDVKQIDISTTALLRIGQVFNDLTNFLPQATLALKDCIQSNYTFSHPKSKAIVKNLSNIFSISVKRLELELNIFCENFGIGIFAFFYSSFYYYQLTGEIEKRNSATQALKDLEPSINSAIKNISTFTTSIDSNVSIEIQDYENTKLALAQIIRLVANELQVANGIIGKMIVALNNL